MAHDICPTCHQTILVMRLGARLTPLKAAIVDAIKAAGDVGISSAEIREAVYRDRAPVNRQEVHRVSREGDRREAVALFAGNPRAAQEVSVGVLVEAVRLPERLTRTREIARRAPCVGKRDPRRNGVGPGDVGAGHGS